MKAKLKGSAKLKGIFNVFVKIINNEFETILKTLQEALKTFENPLVRQLCGILLSIVRGHVASLIAKNFVNIHLKELATIMDLR